MKVNPREIWGCPECDRQSVKMFVNQKEHYFMRCSECGWNTNKSMFPDEVFVDYEEAVREHGKDVQYRDSDAWEIFGFECFGEQFVERPLLEGTCVCGAARPPVIKVQEKAGGVFAGFTAVCPVCSRRVRGMNYHGLERRWSQRSYDWEPSEDIIINQITEE